MNNKKIVRAYFKSAPTKYPIKTTKFWNSPSFLNRILLLGFACASNFIFWFLVFQFLIFDCLVFRYFSSLFLHTLSQPPQNIQLKPQNLGILHLFLNRILLLVDSHAHRISIRNLCKFSIRLVALPLNCNIFKRLK